MNVNSLFDKIKELTSKGAISSLDTVMYELFQIIGSVE